MLEHEDPHYRYAPKKRVKMYNAWLGFNFICAYFHFMESPYQEQRVTNSSYFMNLRGAQ